MLILKGSYLLFIMRSNAVVDVLLHESGSPLLDSHWNGNGVGLRDVCMSFSGVDQAKPPAGKVS